MAGQSHESPSSMPRRGTALACRTTTPALHEQGPEQKSNVNAFFPCKQEECRRKRVCIYRAQRRADATRGYAARLPRLPLDGRRAVKVPFRGF
jgi:hypothetical protein